ncbi:MAG TPA: group III truncated hemoglobin [Rhizomicrobium sp.]|jgi:hemoglobin
MSADAQTATARRAAITAQIQAETGIDEVMIERLVRGFYARVGDDATLGPIFAARIDDWEPHLQKMCAFWSSVALMSGRYHGQPMAKHLPLPVDAGHFDRWLALFAETARDVCPPAAAKRFILLSQRVGESLELGIANANGVLLNKGQRYFKDGERSTLGHARESIGGN